MTEHDLKTLAQKILLEPEDKTKGFTKWIFTTNDVLKTKDSNVSNSEYINSLVTKYGTLTRNLGFTSYYHELIPNDSDDTIKGKLTKEMDKFISSNFTIVGDISFFFMQCDPKFENEEKLTEEQKKIKESSIAGSLVIEIKGFPTDKIETLIKDYNQDITLEYTSNNSKNINTINNIFFALCRHYHLDPTNMDLHLFVKNFVHNSNMNEDNVTRKFYEEFINHIKTLITK